MMKKTIAFLTTASVASFAAPAMAQDVTDTFTGPRVEAIIGYDVSRDGSSVDDDGNEDRNESLKGLMYGAAVGYDVDISGFVVGAEAEYTDSTADIDFGDADLELGDIEAGRDLYVGGRAGMRVGTDALVYVKGGYTNARYDIVSNGNSTPFDENLDSDGYRVGAGAELAFSQGSYVKLEYRYSNYSEAEVNFDNDVADPERFDIDLDRHQVVAAVGFRF